MVGPAQEKSISDISSVTTRYICAVYLLKNSLQSSVSPSCLLKDHKAEADIQNCHQHHESLSHFLCLHRCTFISVEGSPAEKLAYGRDCKKVLATQSQECETPNTCLHGLSHTIPPKATVKREIPLTFICDSDTLALSLFYVLKVDVPLCYKVIV